MGSTSARIQKELKEIERDTASGVTVELLGNDIRRMKGCLQGPKDTPYENGCFYVDIQLDDSYPFTPPKMRFITKVWHPNVSSANGAICLDILKNKWSPALTLKTALLSLQALLASPEPDDPQDGVVAKQYLTEKDVFDQTAKQWTESYAKKDAVDEKVVRLVEMGFDEAAAMNALRTANGDESAALEFLLAGV
mmetsp:Transcript_1804/g.5256  ORF Transcript_1804/g.5256 Transcript_1804/m.5256 type:complete len:194 (-) Transcript_1804:342-923(-)|eukprot:CAMPEP_0117647756 /NCGR_PEP_ID=MMETSP0804-20121206/14_1 /TAXON_ID=1074897 /ORGANISM="Tetraselmis astigmatica, Strain CCMP880" /LENGTH=193 /DNA_ID=CAMNT_0005453259 /DNA_START=301 /DNA_END=882 /DNA_ORIENTATION=+